MGIRVAPGIELDESELQWEFVRASGPGGQNVNKVATAVQLRFDVAHSPSLPDEVRKRLVKLAGRRISERGVLVIVARSTRSQSRNRDAALEELVDLVRRAAVRPKRRHRTKPTAASVQRRLAQKARRSQLKERRRELHRGEE